MCIRDRFGTVWGIIDAFHGLGTAGAATLRAVAPGISEALITTAAGLAAAIPAVIAYNLIGSSIRMQSTESYFEHSGLGRPLAWSLGLHVTFAGFVVVLGLVLHGRSGTG